MSLFTPRPTGLRLVTGAGPEAVPRTEPRDPLPSLWQTAARIWQDIASIWGEPSELAEKGWLSRKDHKAICDWMRHLEMLVRRLLLIAALAFDPGPPPFLSKPPRERRKREPRGIVMEYDNPWAWRVGFTMLTSKNMDEPGGSREREFGRRGPAAIDAWPAALRLEALLRIIEKPEARVKRLARALARLRASNEKANEPRLVWVKPWLLPTRNRTLGMRAIDASMCIAGPIAAEVLGRWQPQPGG